MSPEPARESVSYDPENVFARILRGAIPCKPLYENDHVLAFADITPKAPVHILVIPKGAYLDVLDFGARASQAEIVAFWQAIPDIAQAQGLAHAGFRLIANTGAGGGQEVPHFHVHLLGGAPLGAMVCRS